MPIETRNPKPETRNRQRKWVSIDETRNPKPETDSESWFQATKPETRNPQPETDSESWFQSTKPETRNPKPETRNQLESNFWVALRIGTQQLGIHITGADHTETECNSYVAWKPSSVSLNTPLVCGIWSCSVKETCPKVLRKSFWRSLVRTWVMNLIAPPRWYICLISLI